MLVLWERATTANINRCALLKPSSKFKHNTFRGMVGYYVLTAHRACDRTACVAGVFGCWYVTIILCHHLMGAGMIPPVGIENANFRNIFKFPKVNPDRRMLGNIHFSVLRHCWLLCPTAHRVGDRGACVAGVPGCWYGTIMLCNGGRNHSGTSGRK